jgi:hypothetical protein
MNNEFNGIIVSHKPISESALKRLILIFDKLFFIDPDENNYLIPDGVQRLKVGQHELCHAKYPVLYNGENYRLMEDRLLDSFDYALNKGIIRVLDLRLRKFYEKHWLPLRISYDFDTANEFILNNYLPLVERNPSFKTSNGIIRGGIKPVNGPKIYPDIPDDVTFFNEEENKKYSLDHQVSSMAGKFNRLLAVSDEFNLIPIFINENLARAYSFKAEIARKNSETNLNEVFRQQHKIELNSVQYVLQKISEIILPDDVLRDIPIDELIIARNNSYHECLKIRRKLIKSLKFIGDNRFDDEFIKEVNKYIKMEIIPLVDSYQNKFFNTLGGFLKYSIPFGSAVGSSVIGIQQGLSSLAIAYLSGISTTAGTVTSELSNYIINKRTRDFNNAFSYFINLRE